MTLQIKCIIKTFTAKCAQVTLYFRMTFHMTIEQTLQRERLQTNAAYKFPIAFILLSTIVRRTGAATATIAIHQGRVVTTNGCLLQIIQTINAAYTMMMMTMSIFNSERIFNAMTTIHKFQLYLGWQTQLQ